MQGKRKFYDFEDDQNPLTNKITQKKTKPSKKMPTESKSSYLSISKVKANQFQKQKRKYKNHMKSCKRKIKNI